MQATPLGHPYGFAASDSALDLPQGLGLTVEKWGDEPARWCVSNPASNHPSLLLLCTTQLGFGPGHEWLQQVLQTGSYTPAGVAVCPAAPLPFAVEVALHGLLDWVRPPGRG